MNIFYFRYLIKGVFLMKKQMIQIKIDSWIMLLDFHYFIFMKKQKYCKISLVWMFKLYYLTWTYRQCSLFLRMLYLVINKYQNFRICVFYLIYFMNYLH